MGGGDLNLKKSWHPSTLRNIERVWKAEQKHEAEQQKIEQLQKELAEERSREEIRAFAQDQGTVKKKDERLEWMYQGPAAMVNREEYLMGRKVDKTFEILQQQENGQEEPNDHESKPGAIFSQSSVNTTVDIANKIREDPLFNIMKREKEERKSLLTNPVKMKQLQKMLQKSISKDGKKKKNKKKQRKRRFSSGSSNSSSSETDDDKNQNKKHRSHVLHHAEQLGTHYKASQSAYGKHSLNISSSERNNKGKWNEEVCRSKNPFTHGADPKASTRDAGSQKYQEFDNKREHGYEVEKKCSRNKSKYRQEDSSFGHKTSKSSNHYHSEKNSSDLREKKYHDKKPNDRDWSNNDNTHKNSRRHEKRELGEAEKEHMRQVMMMNAKLRDQQRQKNVKRYKEEDEREDDVDKHKAPDFIRPMLSKAAEKGTVEKRVKQKIFTIQRNHSEMNRNFAKR